MLNVDIAAYKQDIESSWIWNFGRFLSEHWIAIVISLVCLIVIRTLFNNILFPYYYESFKKWYGLESMLSEMKDILEEDYSDLWHESEFCLAFLALQDEHQRLVRLAKSNVHGENPKRFHWANRYAKIHIK
ncbi:unnamed protein product [Caenorhabditis sp. 36 PRJEB53466]|nr:unnamed protein product [Caenorhabditis sp. 36 PRJEB53466]